VIRAAAQADMIVLPQDLARMAAEEIAAVRPEATLFAGRVVFGGL
jgi:predicted amidohydrolase YtcJ